MGEVVSLWPQGVGEVVSLWPQGVGEVHGTLELDGVTCIVGPCALGLGVDIVVGMVRRCGMGICGIVKWCLPV